MLKVQEIREIIKLVDQSSIDEFVYENEGAKLKLKKKGSDQPVQQIIQQAPAPVQEKAPAAIPAEAPKTAAIREETAQQPSVQDENLHTITSPMVGTFYQSPSPEEGPYVKQGSKVTKDSVVCIVEAMKLFNEIEAEINGEIAEILVKDGQLVEYGQPLFTVKPE